ncbi:MAG: hypothetical protein VB049_02300 [Candidatus Pelethousia sp.]|nr:hypothetical protein [Candidatus Pelethousia sp.]
MIDNTVQSAGSRAIAQYTESQAAGNSQSLFAAALETAMGQGSTVDRADIENADGEAAGSLSLKDLAPLLSSGLAQEGGERVLLLLMALLGASGEGSLLSGLNGLGNVGDLLMGGLQDGGIGGLSGSNVGTQATMAAAQSLFKAYQNAAQSDGETLIGGSMDVAAANRGEGNQTRPGRMVTAELMSAAGNRNAALYRSVIDQFNVENNPRYAVNQKGTGDTYCNIFLWDVTSAMGAEIPHYTDKDTGAPTTSGAGNVVSMNANRTCDWLNTRGTQYGWHEVTAEQAQALANHGYPAVAVWKNQAGGHGHVQVVSPSEDGAYDPDRGVAIAQAGRLLRNYTYIRNIYSSRMKEVQYFAHK